jgi:hypothetical protein
MPTSVKIPAREIRECFVPDFSNWKEDDSYTKVFERLVQDLKAPLGDKVADKGERRHACRPPYREPFTAATS